MLENRLMGPAAFDSSGLVAGGAGDGGGCAAARRESGGAFSTGSPNT